MMTSLFRFCDEEEWPGQMHHADGRSPKLPEA